MTSFYLGRGARSVGRWAEALQHVEYRLTDAVVVVGAITAAAAGRLARQEMATVHFHDGRRRRRPDRHCRLLLVAGLFQQELTQTQH